MVKYELCCECNEPTGKAGRGEDSNYYLDNLGPLCDDCRHKLEDEVAENLDLRRQLEEAKAKLESSHAVRDKHCETIGRISVELRDLQARFDALKEAAESIRQDLYNLESGDNTWPEERRTIYGAQQKLSAALADQPSSGPTTE